MVSLGWFFDLLEFIALLWAVWENEASWFFAHTDVQGIWILPATWFVFGVVLVFVFSR